MSGSPEPDRLAVRPTEYGIETLAALARRLSPDSPHSPAATEKVARYRDNYAIVVDADGPAVISALGERTPIPSEVAQMVYRVFFVANTRSRPTRTPWLVLCDAGGRVVMSLPPYGLEVHDLERLATAAGWDLDLEGTELDGLTDKPGSWVHAFPHWYDKPRLSATGRWRASRLAKLKQLFRRSGGSGPAGP